ncbi:MAG: Gfo/Idh/MocA family oxidoreductase [Planctomycetota bacterium]|nr:Gfo/Idh/MocA family oxidoreductase [Planctomycetota bacterium]
MIRVGLAGIGFMGWIHWLAYQKVASAQVTAICSRNPQKRAGDWTDIQGNFGPPGEQVDTSQLATCSTLDELLADESIDLVDLCLPPHLHCQAAIAALQAGKHVFVEKPMGLTTDECDQMVAAAAAADRQVLVGHVLPFFPEYAHARSVIASGTHGRLLGGHFKRVVSDPSWIDDFYDPARVGGPLVDLHVHDAHLIRMLFGMPQSLVSQGRMRGEVVEFCTTLFRYPDTSLVVSASSGVINQQGRPFTHALEIHLEKATLHYDHGGFTDGPETMPLKLLTADDQVLRPDLGDGDPVRAFEVQIEEVVRSIKTGEISAILSGALARDAILLCHKQTESVVTGSPVTL